jgi:hypothetical protein
MKRLLSLFVMIALAAGSWLVVDNAQYISDSYVASQYQPSSDMKKIITQLRLTDYGERMTQIGRPQLSDQDTFNAMCRKHAEQSIVLGCYISPYRIYVYNITDEQLEGIRQVTTAHEMLHVAYDRLGQKKKERLGRLLEEALPSVQSEDPTLAARLELYAKTEPGERENELHSILGTEARDLPGELETYYAQYFTDRRVVVNYAEQYGEIFTNLRTAQENSAVELESLAKTIEAQSAAYNAASSQLNADIALFNERASSGDFDSMELFNTEKQVLTLRRNQLQQDRLAINQNIATYNQKRNELQLINGEVQELNSKLDSTTEL